jgi:hypothetical protein
MGAQIFKKFPPFVEPQIYYHVLKIALLVSLLYWMGSSAKRKMNLKYVRVKWVIP